VEGRVEVWAAEDTPHRGPWRPWGRAASKYRVHGAYALAEAASVRNVPAMQKALYEARLEGLPEEDTKPTTEILEDEERRSRAKALLAVAQNLEDVRKAIEAGRVARLSTAELAPSIALEAKLMARARCAGA
jgi:hypothetical protein